MHGSPLLCIIYVGLVDDNNVVYQGLWEENLSARERLVAVIWEEIVSWRAVGAVSTQGRLLFLAGHGERQQQ